MKNGHDCLYSGKVIKMLRLAIDRLLFTSRFVVAKQTMNLTHKTVREDKSDAPETYLVYQLHLSVRVMMFEIFYLRLPEIT